MVIRAILSFLTVVFFFYWIWIHVDWFIGMESGGSARSFSSGVAAEEAIFPRGVPILSPSIHAEKSSLSSSAFQPPLRSIVAVGPSSFFVSSAFPLSFSPLLSFGRENKKSDVGDRLSECTEDKYGNVEVIDSGRKTENAFAV